MPRFLLALFLAGVTSTVFANSLQECRQISDRNDRLACYDQLADAKSKKSDNYFGKVKYEEIPEDKTFTVVDYRNIHNRFVMTMNDGQVWKQAEANRLFRIDKGDKVIISSGSLSSYFIQKIDTKLKIKVKRLK